MEPSNLPSVTPSSVPTSNPSTSSRSFNVSSISSDVGNDDGSTGGGTIFLASSLMFFGVCSYFLHKYQQGRGDTTTNIEEKEEDTIHDEP